MRLLVFHPIILCTAYLVLFCLPSPYIYGERIEDSIKDPLPALSQASRENYASKYVQPVPVVPPSIKKPTKSVVSTASSAEPLP